LKKNPTGPIGKEGDPSFRVLQETTIGLQRIQLFGRKNLFHKNLQFLGLKRDFRIRDLLVDSLMPALSHPTIKLFRFCKIASLLPAATEVVAALGAAHRLVGRSHECDWPAEVTALPALTRPILLASLSSGEIDQQVKAAAGGALFSLDKTALVRLAPDLILTQATCRVCAIDADEVASAAAKISLPDGSTPQVLTLSPQSLADLFADISRVGEAIGLSSQAADVVERLKARCETVERAANKAVDAAGQKPCVAIVEWLDPPMAAGNWVPELIHLAGGTDALAPTLTNRADSSGTGFDETATATTAPKSHWIEWADLEAADPDVVLLTPCGFEIDRVVSEARSAAVWPHLADLRATREGRLFAVDGHHLFNRPGPRLVDSLEVLAELLHPGVFAFEATARFHRRIMGDAA
jgi:iron complex transport system substrate-binding protein